MNNDHTSLPGKFQEGSNSVGSAVMPSAVKESDEPISGQMHPASNPGPYSVQAITADIDGAEHFPHNHSK